MTAPAPFLVADHPSGVATTTAGSAHTVPGTPAVTPSLADLFAVLDEPAPWSHVAPMTLSEIVAAWWDGEEG